MGYRSIFPPDATKPTPASLAPGWLGLVEDPNSSVLVAADPDIVGCVALTPDDEVPTGWLLARLYVAPRHWSHGVGALLHKEVLAEACTRGLHRLNLWVLEANERARSMYERRGWTLVPGSKLANGEYEPPILDVLYELDLDSCSLAGLQPVRRGQNS